MLITCPKCGFVQPQDQFCANCGVNMATFKPKPPSLAKRLLLSPIFHLLVISAVFFSAFFYIRERRLQEIENRIEYLAGEGSSLIVEKRKLSDSPDSDPPLADTTESAEDATSTTESPPPPPTQKSETAANASAHAGTKSEGFDSQDLAANKAHSPNIKFIFSEIDKESFLQWLEESKGNSNKLEDNVQWGIAASQPIKLRQIKGFKSFSEETKVFSANQSQSQILHPLNPNEEASSDQGLFVDVQATEFTENLIKLDLEVLKNLKENGLLVRKSYNSNFLLNLNQVFYMIGSLPHKLDDKLLETETRPDQLFQIYRSKSFTNGQSEFAIFVHIDKSTPQ